MKHLLGLMVMLVAAALVMASQGGQKERDEFRQSYRLDRGAVVEIIGINGPVEVGSSDDGSAEVYVVRSAKNRDDLSYHKVNVTQTEGRLIIKGEGDKGWGRSREVHQHVVVRLPRQVELIVKGVNGGVNVAEIDDSVTLTGINGRVEVEQASGYCVLSGINGSVVVNFDRIGERGVKISGINGKIELRVNDSFNADLSVTGINGNVITDVPNVTVEGRLSPSNFKAKIGSGGFPINISGVNGNVRIARRGAAAL